MGYGTTAYGGAAGYGGSGEHTYRAGRVRDAYATADDGRPFGCCGKGWGWGRMRKGMG